VNSILQWYRQANPDDPASDEEIILDYGSRYPLEQLPEDFVADFQRVSQQRDVTGSSVGSELARGFKRGYLGLKSAGAGLGALASDLLGAETPKSYFQDVFARTQQRIAEEAPASVPAIEGAFASPQALSQYVAGKAGELVPNVGEALALAGAGALAGSAAAPGPGTAGGALAGGLAGVFARGAARAAIKRTMTKAMTAEVKKELEDYAAGKVIEKGLSTAAAKILKDSAAYLGAVGVSIADASLQGAGYGYGITSTTEGVSPEDARVAALISGAGGSLGAIIPIGIIRGVFGDAIGIPAARSYIDLYAKQVPVEILSASGGMGAMEFFNILGERYADPRRRDEEFTKEEWSRLLNAAAVGGMAGTPAGVIRAVRGVEREVVPPPKPETVPAAQLEPTQAPETPQAMTATEVRSVYDKPITAEQELVMRGVAARERAKALTDADQVYLDQLPATEAAAYATIKEEIENATRIRKGKEEVPSEREGDRGIVRPKEEDRERPTVVQKEGDQDGARDQLQEAARELTPEVRQGLENQGIKVEEIITPERVASVPLVITKEMEQSLADLGYSKELRNNLNPEQAQLIIRDQIQAPKAEVVSKARAIATEEPVTPKPEAKPPAEVNWLDNVRDDYTAWMPLREGKEREQMFRDIGRDPNNKNNTKALGVFETPEGKIIVASIYDNRGQKVFLGGKTGVAWESALENGYKPIETIRTKTQQGGFFKEYTKEQWAEVRGDLESKASEARAAVVLPTSEAAIGTAATATGEISPEGLRVAEKAQQRLVSEEPHGSLNAEDALRLHDLVRKQFGQVKADTAADNVADALLTDPGLLGRIRDVGRDRTGELLSSIIDAYERIAADFERRGETDPGKFQSAITRELEGLAPTAAKTSQETPGGLPEDARQSRPVAVTREPGTAEQATIGTHVVQRLANVGIPVQKFKASVNGLAEPLGQSMGSYDRGAKTVSWVLADLSAPNKHDLRVLFEEAGHALFDRESRETVEPILRAIARMEEITPSELEQVRRDVANAYPEGVRPDVYQEELMMGWISRKLMDEGFNPVQSHGLAQSIVRLVKELYLKAAMWVQQNILGDPYNNPDLSLRFWQNRLEGFLAGDQETLSWINRLGGGKKDTAVQVQWHTPVSGSKELVQTYNPLYGRIDTEPILIDSVEAAMLSQGAGDMRYSIPDPGAIPEPYVAPEVRLNRDAAVNNEVEYWRTRAATANGIGLEEFRKLNGLRGDTTKIRQYLDKTAAAQNADGYRPGQRISEFTHEENAQPSYVRAAAQLQNEEARVARNLEASKEALPIEQEKHEKLLRTLDRELDNYTDARFMEQQVKDGFRRLALDQIRQERRGSQALGVIMQQARALEDQIGRPVDPAVVQAIRKLFTGTELEGQNLFQLLDFMANDESIDFSLPASQIRQAIRQRAEMIPEFVPYQIITSNTPEGKALLATVVGFGKYHRRLMTLLEMRRMRSGEERVALEQKLKDLRKQTSQQINTGIRQVARGAKLEERASSHYRRILRNASASQEVIKHIQKKIEINQKALPVYRQAIDEIGSKIALTEDSTFGDGMVVRVPTSADFNPTWEERTVNLNTAAGAVTTPEQLQSWANQIATFTRNREAMAKQGNAAAMGLDYQRAKRQLNEIINNRFYQAALRNTDHWTTELVLGPAPKKMEAIGTAAGSQLGIMLRKWMSGVQSMRNQSDKDFGYKNSRLEQQAKGILNKGRPRKNKVSHEWFAKNIVDAAIGFMERMQPTEGMSREAALNRDYAKLGEWLLGQELLRPVLSGRMAEFLPALRSYLDSLYESGQFWMRKNKEAGLLVEDPKLGGMLRSAYRVGLLTVPRKFSDRFNQMVYAMRNSGWATSGRDKDGVYGDFSNIANLHKTNRPALDAMLAKYMDHPVYGGTVRDDFIYTLTHLPDQSPFMSPEIDAAGTTVPVEASVISKAYDDAKGDLVRMFELIHERMDGVNDVADYVQSGFQTFLDQFHAADSALRKIEPQEGTERRSLVNVVPNAMIDARAYDHWPVEWFTYHKFDRNDNARLAERVSGQMHFGRNSEVLDNTYKSLLNDTNQMEAKLRVVLGQAERMTPSGRRRDIKAAAAKILDKDKSQALSKLKNGTERLDYLLKVEERAPQVRAFLGEFSDYFQRGNQDVGSLRWGVRIAQELASLMVNQPGTAIQQLATMFDIPVQWGASPTMLNVTRRVVGLTAKDIAGSLAQGIGWKFLNLSTYERRFKELGLIDPEISRRFSDVTAVLQGEEHNRLARASRVMKDLQSFTVNPLRERAQYTPLRPLAPFSQTVMSANRALTIAIWELADRYVSKGMEYLKRNPGKDKLTAADLGLKGLDKDSFERFQASMEGYGLDFNEMVRGAIDRKASGDNTILTNQQLERLYSMGLNEVSLENNLSTMPIAAFNNSVLRFISPLLGWSFRRASQVGRLRLDPKEQRSIRAASTALLGLGAAGLGGLGLSLVVDAYQEDVLGKRRNIRDLRVPTTANDWLALQERVARAGTLGLFGEAINSAVNIGTGQGDNRMLSADQRIVALQSFHGLMNALTSLYHQDFDPDYQHVVRPFFAALGGNGLLQYMQIANRMVGADNVESRTVRRINAQNYLRVTGRDLEMPIRVSNRGYGTPTPMTPWIARMEFAAYANSPAEFREAYRGAIQKAKEIGKADPEDYVKRAFETRHPLRYVFSQIPSEQEYRRILGAMDDNGRDAVTEAIRMFNYYGAHIGVTPFQGSTRKNRSARERLAAARALAGF